MKRSSLSSEDQLLLYYARTRVDDEIESKAERLLKHTLDWQYILDVALRHRIAPLLYSHLKKHEQSVPPEIFQNLKTSYYTTGYCNARSTQAATLILEAFNSNGIAVMFLKGLSLIELLYKNPALRPCSDIDLLILKEDLPKAIDVLENLGYTLPGNMYPIEFYTKYHFHLTFLKKDYHESKVEIHWHLTDDYRYPFSETLNIWQDARHQEICELPAMTMALEDLLIYLCLHLDRHGIMNRFIYNKKCDYGLIINDISMNRLLWFVDIYELIKYSGSSIDWASVINKTKKWDKNGCVASSLFFTNWLFHMELDPDILDALNPPTVSFSESLLYGYILRRFLRKKKKDYVIKLYEKKILGMNERLQIHPISLLYLNHKAFILPKLVLGTFKRSISRWIGG